MNRTICASLIVLLACCMSSAFAGKWDDVTTAADLGIDPAKIDIVRDSFGTPHIYAKTDREVAYGLAWATCEDDFETLQWGLLAAKGMMGRHLGPDGAKIDFAAQMLQAKQTVDAKYETEVSDHFKAMIDAFVAAANDYARKNPKEVIVKKSFPVTAKDLLTGYVLVQCLMSGVDGPLGRMVAGEMDDIYKDPVSANGQALNSKYEEDFFKHMIGSNAFAFGPEKTKDGNTYLAINSHQPIEGPLSWYEIHVCSEEGWNMMGGTFHGGMSVFHGTNEHLGWAHTSNDFDRIDVFQLEMHPTEKHTYKFDGEWHKLEQHKARMVVKLKWLPFKLTVKKKYFWSKYGATIQNKKNKQFYSIKLPANEVVGAPEQWFWMNKTTNLEEFKQVISRNQLALQNITYADKEGNIFFISNGMVPKRNPNYDWSKVVPGNTSETLWTSLEPTSVLPQMENPDCGWLFNANQNPFFASTPKCDLGIEDYKRTLGFDERITNRALRTRELMETKYTGKISWQDFLNIKYDQSYAMDSMVFLKDYSIHDLFTLDPQKYPDIASSIERISKFYTYRKISLEDRNWPITLMAFYYAYLGDGNTTELRESHTLREEYWANSVRKAQKHLIKHFGTVDITVGDVQRLRREGVDLPVAGGPDVLRAFYCHPPEDQKDGRLRGFVGDSYIQLVKFTPDGPEMSSINAFGAANKPGEKHTTDQMVMYTHIERKPITLDKAEVYKKAEIIYHPE